MQTKVLPAVAIGEHPLIQKVYAVVRRVAGTDATVLITGESGTGKELVTQCIHNLSRRVERPLVSVNCAAIPTELLESELFGHVRGAFSGAVSSREGMFQSADGGTLLLDEVGEIPLSLQPKLLRTLQNGEVKPVGADRPHRVSVRVVASTNRDLTTDVEKGLFRQDLFYRLRVIHIHLPPLRARQSDIPFLAHHFLENNNDKYGLSVRFSKEAMTYLQKYDWPGNIRELENLIEQLVILKEDTVIHPVDLPTNIFPSFTGEKVALPPLSDQGVDLKHILEQIETQLIHGALYSKKGNVSAAAQMLRLKRTTLVAKLRKFKELEKRDSFSPTRVGQFSNALICPREKVV